MRVIETYSSSRRPRPRNQGNRHTDKLCLHMTHHSNAAGHPYMLAQKQKRHAKQRWYTEDNKTYSEVIIMDYKSVLMRHVHTVNESNVDSQLNARNSYPHKRSRGKFCRFLNLAFFSNRCKLYETKIKISASTIFMQKGWIAEWSTCVK